jgi:signal transduction histidine kinase
MLLCLMKFGQSSPLTIALLSNDFLMITSVAALIVIGASAFVLWAMRLAQIQNARAEGLARNLQNAREESKRRLHFLNTISHDLRTPLNGMTLQIHVIEQAVQSHDERTIQQALHDIRSSFALAAEILDSLLQYARTEVEQNSLTKVRLKELIHQTSDPFRAAAEEKMLAFSIDAPADLLVETDRNKLQHILANLLDNAVKFTARGSIIVRAGAAQSALWIDIIDTGDGIPPAHQQKLFHEFFQANNPSRDARLGLGLGLVVAHRLAEQLGGTIHCESELHKGSGFRIELPLQRRTAVATLNSLEASSSR